MSEFSDTREIGAWLAGVLVISLIILAGAFYIFATPGPDISNVKTVDLTSAFLNSGPATTTAGEGANLKMNIDNPLRPTFLSQLSLSLNGTALPTSYFSCSSQASRTSLGWSLDSKTFPVLSGRTMLTLYLGDSLNMGSTYSYVIIFGDGQSISGSLTAQ